MGTGLELALFAAAGATAASAVYGMAQGSPKIPAPPPPASYWQYDEDGNALSVQVWDEKKGGYVNKVDPEPEFDIAKPDKKSGKQWVEKTNPDGETYSVMEDVEESDESYNARLKEWEEKRDTWRADSEEWQKWSKRKEERDKDKALRKDVRSKALSNLNQTPEDRVAAYEEYAKNFASSMQKHVDKEYGDISRQTRESMEARGMTGSRADVDLQSELASDKLTADVDIAQKAGMAKEQLAQADKDFWLRTVAELDAGMRGDAALALQQQQAAQQGAMQGTSALMARYAADSDNKLRKWQTKMQQAGALTNAFGGLAGALGMAHMMGNSSPLKPQSSASGLGYLYGYGKAPALNYTKPSWLL